MFNENSGSLNYIRLKIKLLFVEQNQTIFGSKILMMDKNTIIGLVLIFYFL